MSLAPKLLHRVAAVLVVISAALPCTAEMPAPTYVHPQTRLGHEYVTAYVYRGIERYTDGASFQLDANGSFPIIDPDDGSLWLRGGAWASYHPSQSAAYTPVLKGWQEVDTYADLSTGPWKDTINLAVAYCHYQFPNNSFRPFQELTFSVFGDAWASDDGPWLRGVFWALSASFLLKGQALRGSRSYGSLTFEPHVLHLEWPKIALDASVPLVLGEHPLSARDSNGQETWKLALVVQPELSLSSALKFIPARLGAWEMAARSGLSIVNDPLARANPRRLGRLRHLTPTTVLSVWVSY